MVVNQTSFAQVTNYYGTPDVITFNNIDYNFSWSAHPDARYYKHEYLPKGEVADHFNTMLMLEFIQGDLSAKDAAQAQIKELIKRKKTDVVCNYDMVESPDGKEFILDFLMSDGEADKLRLVEWNAYHYKAYTDKAGHNGVVLFGLSHRAYGGDISAFLKSLHDYRQTNRNEIIKFPIPEIQIK
jgi:hypothetical protein